MRIRSALRFRPDLRIGLLTLAINQALAAGALWLMLSGSPVAFVASQLILPIVYFQAFSILHDCGHGSYASKRWQNTLIGHFASLFCFLPYFPWKYQHAQHHAWAGHLENDPSLGLLRAWRKSGKLPWPLRVAWRTWIPLGAFLQHFVFWSYPLTSWRRAGRAQRLRCVFSVMWLGASYTALVLLWPSVFTAANFGGSIVAYLIAVELVNLPHHVDRPSVRRRLALWEQAYPTRSCYYPRGVSEFFVLNFNFHVEHHLFPNLPWYQLRNARALIRPALGRGYTEDIGISWNLRRRNEDMLHVLGVE